MKKLITLVVAFTSFAAFSSVELAAVSERTKCTIKDGAVTRTQTFGKTNVVGFTETHQITTNGLEEVLKLAEAAARPHTETERDFMFKANVDGRIFDLHMDDSKEALSIVQLMVKACRFN